MARLASVFSAAKWRQLFASWREMRRRKAGDDRLDALWAARGPVPRPAGDARLLVADGLWFNPGFFLRLRLFVEAAAAREPLRLLGVLRSRADERERRALERIGFKDFIYIADDTEFPSAAFEAEARRLLAGAKTHADLVALPLPGGVPAYLWYDTVLRRTRHGQPPLDHPEWQRSLIETLAAIAVYRRLLAGGQVAQLALSHAWGNVHGSLAWLGLQQEVPAFCVTHFSDAIRIRRFRVPADLDLPVEHLPRHVYDSLDCAEQLELSRLGRVELERRQGSQSSDINIRHAYALSNRHTDRNAARRAIGAGERPVGVIYGHSWFDFPHLYHMRNFVDFIDWFVCTVEAIRGMTHIDWFLKPHPMETWYGGHTMADMIGELPGHVRVLGHDVDTLTVMTAADAIVTVHGTAALEAGAMGTAVIAADNSYYADWDFAETARSREHYVELLARVGALPPSDAGKRARALACFVAAYGEPHEAGGALRLPCDSGGSGLFAELADIVEGSVAGLTNEAGRIRAFLDQDEIDSFESWSFVSAARRLAAGRISA